MSLWRRAGWAWCAVAAAMALGTVLAWGLETQAIDWQPEQWPAQPWRAWSAVFVHYSTMHLAGNAAGLALVTALGVAAKAPSRLALAWLAAWPLTQIGLLSQPAIAHYGGLSGVVHAGVAIVTLHLMFAGHRWLGGAIFGMLVLKVLSEAPWGPPLRHPQGWDIAIAPLAHACGLIAGAACALVAEGLARWHRGRARRRA